MIVEAPTRQSRLFRSAGSLHWLPGETIYSLASRFHFLAGRGHPADTSRLLFGTARGGFPPVTPGGVAHFADAFEQSLGTAREVLEGHSVLPQLLAVRPSALREAAYRITEQGPVASLKARLGLLASGFGGSLPLKACRQCLAEDVLRHGTGYWRTEHLLPGVWVCRHHGEPLEVLASERTGQARYKWVLPRSDELAPPTTVPWMPKDVPIVRLMEMARASVWLWEQGRHGVDLQQLTREVRARLVELGYASERGRLKQAAACAAFTKYFDRVRDIPELARVAATPTVAYSQLQAVLHGRGMGLHPLRVASVLAWLFRGSAGFSEGYVDKRSAVATAQPTLTTTLQKGGGVLRKELVARVMAGESVSSVARAVGVEVVTGQAWVAAEGVAVPVRPSTLVGDHRRRIVAALSSGADKDDVERRFEVSASTVNRLLRTEVGLHAAWKEARESDCRMRMRSRWLEQLSAVSAGPKYARQLAPSAYAWLYRNDREWLRQVNLQHEIEPGSNNARVDWDGRDQGLSQAVLNAALDLHDRGDMPIRLVDILARVPELKSKLKKLNRLPLTSRALDQVLRFSRRKRA